MPQVSNLHLPLHSEDPIFANERLHGMPSAPLVRIDQITPENSSTVLLELAVEMHKVWERYPNARLPSALAQSLAGLLSQQLSAAALEEEQVTRVRKAQPTIFLQQVKDSPLGDGDDYSN